jgi:hypothetical protein
MNNTCAFCSQLVEHFIRCHECGEPICAEHRTVRPTPVEQPVVVEDRPFALTRYLCPNHRGASAALSADTDLLLAVQPTRQLTV